MIVENQNNAAGVQFKMLTMWSQGERRAGGVWKSVVGCGKLHALYKLKPQAQRQPHHHGTVAWVLWTWTWIGIGHGWVVCAAPPAVVFVVTSLCKKHSERKRHREKERQRRNSNNNNGNFSYDIFGFCALRGHSTAKSTKDARLHLSITAGGGAALLDGMGWLYCCEVVNFSCTILMGIMSGSKIRSAKLKLCGKTLYRDWERDWDCKPQARDI